MEISSYWPRWHLKNGGCGNAMMVVMQSPSLNLRHFLTAIRHGVALSTAYGRTKNQLIEETMKPFDLEAARRGEPVELLYRGQWVPAHFIGLDRNRQPVFDCAWDAFPYSLWKRENIRMAPKRMTVYVNIWSEAALSLNGANFANWFKTPELAEAASKSFCGKSPSALAVAVPIEITE